MWAIHYDDGAVVTDATPVEAVPSLGVIAITYRDYDGTQRTLAKWDYFCWNVEAGQWYGADLFGLFDYLIRDGWKRVIFGRTVDNATWQGVMKAATDYVFL